jgi:hypothetical protein
MAIPFHPFRDELAVAVERAERLARDNAILRAKLAAGRWPWIVWPVSGVMALCVVALVYLVAVGITP